MNEFACPVPAQINSVLRVRLVTPKSIPPSLTHTRFYSHFPIRVRALSKFHTVSQQVTPGKPGLTKACFPGLLPTASPAHTLTTARVRRCGRKGSLTEQAGEQHLTLGVPSGYSPMTMAMKFSRTAGPNAAIIGR